MSVSPGAADDTAKRPPIVWLVFCMGLAGVIAGTIGIRTAHDISWIRFFDNLHWTSGTAAAAILGWLGYWSLKGTERSRTVVWFALGLTLYAIGQIVWDIQTALAFSAFPTPSDLFYLWLGPGLCAGLLREIRKRARNTEFGAILLDLLALAIAALTLVLALYLPRQGQFGAMAMIVLTAYPATLITATCIGVALIPVLRLKNTLRLWTFLACVAVTAWSWMTWNLMALAGTATDGAWFNVSFSYSVLLMGLVISGWKLEPSGNPAWERMCEGMLRIAPLMSVIAACCAVLVTAGTDVPHVSEHAVQVGAGLVIVLAAIRQVMLLRERDQLFMARKDSETRFRTLADNAPDAIIRYDRNARRIYVNPAFEKATGISAAAALEIPPADNWCGSVPLPEYLEHLKRVLETGQPDEVFMGWPDRDGAPLHYSLRMVPEYDQQERVIGVLVISRNVTALKQAQEEMQHLNRTLEKRVMERTAELEAKNADLEKMLKAFVGRELRMVELKERIRELEQAATPNQTAGNLPGTHGEGLK